MLFLQVTPKAIRLRKRYLDVNKRKTMSKRPKEDCKKSCGSFDKKMPRKCSGETVIRQAKQVSISTLVHGFNLIKYEMKRRRIQNVVADTSTAPF
ncbi:hypothetical protein WN944_010039 [Citrus x changshan-huyou]|uniref:Uncharacterized protein n=1 Tax=Citrus x changshan-huyou TaxID=2935761 RepID=A0AAP0MWF6_9ROSI